MWKLTAKEKMDRLRKALLESRNVTDAALLAKLDRCRTDWNQRYRCRSPACHVCRRRHVAREQKIIQNTFGERPNDELAFVSVVIGSTGHVNQIGNIIHKCRQDTRNRMKACRRLDRRWEGVCVSGWFEIDAVGADHVPLLPPQRRRLVDQLAVPGFDAWGPTWLPSWHGIVHLNGLSPQTVAAEFRRQWPLDRQVHVAPFDLSLPVDDNLASVTAYSNKFDCSIKLQRNVVEVWPAQWEAELFGWLNSGTRNAWEALRMWIGQPHPRQNSAPVVESEDDIPMPFVHSFTGDSMYIYTGPSR